MNMESVFDTWARIEKRCVDGQRRIIRVQILVYRSGTVFRGERPDSDIRILAICIL